MCPYYCNNCNQTHQTEEICKEVPLDSMDELTRLKIELSRFQKLLNDKDEIIKGLTELLDSYEKGESDIEQARRQI